MLNGVGPLGSEFRVNTYTDGTQWLPSVAMDEFGNSVVVWASGNPGEQDGIYAQRYNRLGVPLGGEFRVNTYSDDGDWQWNIAFPDVAMDSSGNFVVTWRSNGQDGGGSAEYLSGGGIYAQRFNALGIPQGGEFRVNTYTTGDQATPDVAMDDSGEFVITWISNAQDGSSGGIYAQRYNSLGVAQGGEFRVNTYTTDWQGDPVVAMDGTGTFAIAWTSGSESWSEGQDGSSYGIYAHRYSASGIPQGNEFRVNTLTDNRQEHPAIAMDKSGSFVIAWDSYGRSVWDVKAQRYNPMGVTQGGEFQVNSGIGGLDIDACGDITQSCGS